MHSVRQASVMLIETYGTISFVDSYTEQVENLKRLHETREA